jgi:hypothetical protein
LNGSEDANNYVNQSGVYANYASNGASFWVFQTPTINSGDLLRAGVSINSITGTLRMHYSSGSTETFGVYTTTGDKIAYKTSYGADFFGFVRGGAVNTLINNSFLQKVTDPPSTAVRIVSTQNGATRAWTRQDAAFLPNDSAGQTYSLIFCGD